MSGLLELAGRLGEEPEEGSVLLESATPTEWRPRSQQQRAYFALASAQPESPRWSSSDFWAEDVIRAILRDELREWAHTELPAIIQEELKRIVGESELT